MIQFFFFWWVGGIKSFNKKYIWKDTSGYFSNKYEKTKLFKSYFFQFIPLIRSLQDFILFFFYRFFFLFMYLFYFISRLLYRFFRIFFIFVLCFIVCFSLDSRFCFFILFSLFSPFLLVFPWTFNKFNTPLFIFLCRFSSFFVTFWHQLNSFFFSCFLLASLSLYTIVSFYSTLFSYCCFFFPFFYPFFLLWINIGEMFLFLFFCIQL